MHNLKPYQKKQGCRKDIFYQYEYPVMANLPNELFEIKKITKAKVQRNYHVFLGQEKNYYSVPYHYVGKQALIYYNRTLVEIYIDRTRVAVHTRLEYHNCNAYQTQQAHLPQKHKQWAIAQGYDGAYFLHQASCIGQATHWVIQQVLLSNSNWQKNIHPIELKKQPCVARMQAREITP